MSRNGQRAMGTPKKIFSAILCLLLGSSVYVCAQASPKAAADARVADDSYPEQAYLSASTYVNQYFGFSFELPSDAHLQPVPQPAARDGSVQVLQLAGPAPVDAGIAILALPAVTSKQDAKIFVRNALDQELYRGVEEIHGLSKASLAGHVFYLFETRRGIEQHMVLATVLDEYIMEVVLASHDEKELRHLETAFEHIIFFAPADTRHYVTADAQPYDGPAISSHRLTLLESDPPEKHIDAGKINGDFYENGQIGFSYRIPQGWVLQSEGAVQSAIERYRAREDFGRPRMGRTERRLMNACSRTLFSAWAKRPGADGQVSYDDFGEVTVSAMAADCFPTIKFPDSPTDHRAFNDFVAQFGLTHPILDDMRDAKAFIQDGAVFLVLHGTVAFQIPDEELSRRLSLAMVITQRRGYLLTWFFAAPHDEELRALTEERVIFDSPADVVNAAASAAPTVTGDAASAKTLPAPTASASAPQTSAASADTANSATAGNAAPATADQSPAAADTSKPTLLRPGETMESQQGKGQLINKQK